MQLASLHKVHLFQQKWREVVIVFPTYLTTFPGVLVLNKLLKGQ